MTQTLVIGYGNRLRRDDGAGPWVAERFAGRPGIRVIVVHQLLPELADELAACQRVVFVDAAASAVLVSARVIEPASRQSCLGHTCDPASLLGLTAALHGVSLKAWLVTVPAHDLGHGEGLSKETESATEATVLVIERLIEGHE